MAAVRTAFSSGGGRDRETAIRDVARALGFERVGSIVRDVLDSALRTASRRDVFFTEQGVLIPGRRNIGDYSRDRLIQYLFAVIGRGWWNQESAIHDTARYLGFRRVGSAIHDEFKRAIATGIRRGLIERKGEIIRRVPE